MAYFSLLYDSWVNPMKHYLKKKNKKTDNLKTDFNKYSDNNQQKKSEVDWSWNICLTISMIYNFSWADGTPVTYTSFPGTPGNRDDDIDPKCVFMYYDTCK